MRTGAYHPRESKAEAGTAAAVVGAVTVVEAVAVAVVAARAAVRVQGVGTKEDAVPRVRVGVVRENRAVAEETTVMIALELRSETDRRQLHLQFLLQGADRLMFRAQKTGHYLFAANLWRELQIWCV